MALLPAGCSENTPLRAGRHPPAIRGGEGRGKGAAVRRFNLQLFVAREQEDDSQERGNRRVPVLKKDAPIERMLVGRAVLERFRRREVRRPGLLKMEQKGASIDDIINGDKTDCKASREKKSATDDISCKESADDGPAPHPAGSFHFSASQPNNQCRQRKQDQVH